MNWTLPLLLVLVLVLLLLLEFKNGLILGPGFSQILTLPKLYSKFLQQLIRLLIGKLFPPPV